MLILLDNNTRLGLAIRNQVGGISRAIDSINHVPRLSSGGAHPPEHLLTTSSTASAISCERHLQARGHAVEVTFVNFVKRSKER